MYCEFSVLPIHYPIRINVVSLETAKPNSIFQEDDMRYSGSNRYKYSWFSKYRDSLVAIVACLLVLTFVVLLMMAKMDAYGGDPACFFVKCVKVIR